MRRGFVGIPLLVILITVAIGGYLIYQRQYKPAPVQQTSDIKSWKTYKTNNFSFQYPEDWSLKNFPPKQLLIADSPKIKVSEDIELSLYSFSILVEDNREKMKLEQIVERHQAELGPGGHELDIVGKTTLDDREAYELLYRVDTGEETMIMIVIDKEEIYTLTLRVQSPQAFTSDDSLADFETQFYAEFKSIGHQIFSTFKFLEPGQQ